MSVAAIVALAHDLVITVGVYALSGFEVTPGDRHRRPDDPRLLALRHRRRVRQGAGEHQRTSAGTHQTYAEAANLAVNQTLVRSINTSIVALLPVGALLYVGVVTLGSGRAQGPRRWRCSSAWRPAPTRRSSSPRRCSCSSRSASPASGPATPGAEAPLAPRGRPVRRTCRCSREDMPIRDEPGTSSDRCRRRRGGAAATPTVGATGRCRRARPAGSRRASARRRPVRCPTRRRPGGRSRRGSRDRSAARAERDRRPDAARRHLDG